MGWIYRITSPSGKSYIGKTTKTVTIRWAEHVRAARRKNYPLSNAIRKYGDALAVEELFYCFRDTDLDDTERELIKAFETKFPTGYNLTDGGDGQAGVIIKESTRLLHSINGKGRLHSEETKRKIAAGNRGKVYSEELRRKIGAKSRGRKHSAESRLKMRLNHQRKKNPFIGQWAKLHVSIPIVDQNGTVYPSATEAAKALGLQRQSIVHVLKGRRHHTGGYAFSYLNASNEAAHIKTA